MNIKTDNGNEQITSAYSKLQKLERLVDQKLLSAWSNYGLRESTFTKQS